MKGAEESALLQQAHRQIAGGMDGSITNDHFMSMVGLEEHTLKCLSTIRGLCISMSAHDTDLYAWCRYIPLNSCQALVQTKIK